MWPAAENELNALVALSHEKLLPLMQTHGIRLWNFVLVRKY